MTAGPLDASPVPDPPETVETPAGDGVAALSPASDVRPVTWHYHCSQGCGHRTGTADPFFPNYGENTNKAKAICDTCPVQPECLHHALTQPEKHGIWGGTTPRQRQQIRMAKRRGRAA